jgi:hypothetical protein
MLAIPEMARVNFLSAECHTVPQMLKLSITALRVTSGIKDHVAVSAVEWEVQTANGTNIG